jgi:chemotaxis protein methyltransferase CheR
MNSLLQISRSLQNPEDEVRRAAVEKLRAESSPEALRMLNQALGDESWRVRKSAVEALAGYPDTPAVVSLLITALYDADNAGRRAGAVEALAKIGEAALEALFQAFTTQDGDVRKFVVDILSLISSPAAVEVLVQALDDPEENVRMAAVEALGNQGADRAYNKLLQIVEQPEYTLAFAALHALGKMGREIPFPLIRRLVERKTLRRAVFEALGQSFHEEAVALLIAGLSDSSKSSRQAAIRSLANIHEKTKDQGLRRAVELSLRQVFGTGDSAGIAEFLDSAHQHTKRSAVHLLGLIANSAAFRQLLRALPDDSLRPELTRTLARIRLAAPDSFQQVLREQEESVQEKVRELLQDAGPLVAGVPRVVPVAQLSDPEFVWVRDRLSNYCGIYFDDELKYLLERRLVRRLEALGMRGFGEYILYLQRPVAGAQELNLLIENVATYETYFFREDFQLRAFREEILPEIKARKEKSGDRRLRVFSAGCSSGEEPYTIAMLVLESQAFSDWKVEILAGDISTTMIEQARRGVYSASSFRVTEEYHLQKYFTPAGNKREISPAVKELVRFRQLNLLELEQAGELTNLDVIFCRNVIIYFNQEAKRKLVAQFHRLLNDEGFLLLGHSESLMNLSTSFRLRHLRHDLVYQKPPREAKGNG